MSPERQAWIHRYFAEEIGWGEVSFDNGPPRYGRSKRASFKPEEVASVRIMGCWTNDRSDCTLVEVLLSTGERAVGDTPRDEALDITEMP